jgi:catechol 2,3-dioxygenase-like lactoylglutathione lyase family enzyme
MSRLFGPVRQNGYVVRDIERALAYWTETLGIGPFYLIDDVPVRNFRFRGEPSEPELTIALGNTGDLQIELIQQRNDAPSMYQQFLAAGREGLQHIACWTDEFDGALARAEARGFRVGQSGQIGRNGRFVYFDAEDHPGTVLELSEISGPKGEFFARIREEAATWDGRDPIRRP